jgi:MATE family multidrug resistance protein
MSVNSTPAMQHGWTMRIANLAWPILIGQLATITNGVIDTIMTARYSAMDLAALGLGSSVYISIFVGLSGVLQALSPAIGQLFGARKFTEIGFEVRQGAWLAIFLSLLGAIFLCIPGPLLAIAQPSAALNDKVVEYLQILALALPATLGFRVFTSLNTATSRPRMVMTIQVCALLLKIPLNYLFIFGGLGLPAFGTPGCAIATAVTAWATLLTGWFIIRRGAHYKAFHIFGKGWSKPVWQAQAALLKLGVPMGLSYLIEVTAFTFMALFISRMGSDTLAGHQVTGNLGTVLYMLPLSIAHATGTLVAQEIGAGRLVQARHSGNAGIRLGVMLSVATGIIVWVLREEIIALYTPDAIVAAAAMPLFFFISFYQLFDAIQVGTAFVLRAYKVALIPTIMYAFALWGVGLFGGYLLGFNVFGFTPIHLQGAAGFWMGNSFSLALVGMALLWYLKHIQGLMETEAGLHTQAHSGL